MLVDGLRSGIRVGNCHIGRRLASGRMAEIYAAETVGGPFDHPVLVKRMLPHLVRDRHFVDVFIAEARLSTMLDHPSIVRVHDFEATERGLFLVMERVDGPDLLSLLQRCAKAQVKIPTELAVHLTIQVLEALDYAHNVTASGRRLKVVHRDVSPGNVLLSRRGRIKLADFGIARGRQPRNTTAQGTATGTLKGKHGYMSPEQVGGGRIDGRSDLFSAAIVLAEMLMGRRLFCARTELETLLMVRRADLTRLDRHGGAIPKRLSAILRQGLTVDANRRFSCAAEFRDALADWMNQARLCIGANNVAAFLHRLEERGGAIGRLGRLVASSGTTVGTQQPRRSRKAMNRPAIAVRQALAPTRSFARRSHESWQLRDEVPITAGTLGSTPLIDVFCFIAQQRLTGKLVVRQDERTTEAYVHNGNPVFVRSNVPHHRFGQYLFARGALAREQLGRALSAMPRCGGRLGQTLVSLNLLTAREAVRLLADQVAFKLIDTCSWTRGTYRFYAGESNPWPALQLDLSTFEIIAKCIHTLPAQVQNQWRKRFAGELPKVDPDLVVKFGFDSYLQAHLRGMLGFQPLEKLADEVIAERQPEFVACCYALWRCGGMEFKGSKVASSQDVVSPVRKPKSKYHRDRKHRRVRYCARGEITVARTGRYQEQPKPIPIEICDVTCTGIGARPELEDVDKLSRGTTVTLRFSTDKDELELPGRIAWCAGDDQQPCDFGVELLLEIAPASVRETYAQWVVGLIARTPQA